jgi:arginyl-tRNA synthetase
LSPTTAEALRTAVEDAARSLAPEGARPKARPTLERPKKAEFGDFSTNAAMLYAPLVKAPPRDVAERLGEALTGRLGAGLEKVEVAGPGFLNLWLSDAWHLQALRDVLAAGDRFGAGGAARAEKVNVEFVSSNPTGPVHIGHARGAAYGDALSRILAFHGHEVHREFYVNDAGSQIEKFTESIRARARGEDVPEGGYQADYVRELAELLPDGPDLGERAVAEMVRRMRETLERFRVEPFGTWFSEATLHEGSPSAVDRAFARLDEQGRLYRSEGALWLRTSDLGDDKDRVLVRSSGEHTYFASDIAYHWDKHERGHERLLDVWGADHHGYVPRMKVMWQALGEDPDALELLIMQFVHLVSGGERASMSKRAGEFVTLDDLVGEIGVDAARWFLLNRSHDTTIDLDLELAVSESKQNPVYYVQYAHARIASLLARAGAEGIAAEPPSDAPLEAEERALVQKLLAFPAEVAEAADRRAPHRITTYALELAQAFTAFYDRHPVLKADDAAVRSARLALCVATRQVVAEALGLLGVSAPESM